MLRFVISTAFCGAALIRARPLLEGDICSDLSVSDAVLIRGWRLMEARHLSEEVRYVCMLVCFYV